MFRKCLVNSSDFLALEGRGLNQVFLGGKGRKSTKCTKGKLYQSRGNKLYKIFHVFLLLCIKKGCVREYTALIQFGVLALKIEGFSSL